MHGRWEWIRLTEACRLVRVWSNIIDQTEISRTVLDAPVQITAFPRNTLFRHWCGVASQLENAFRYSSLGIVFSSEFTALARSWTRENFLSASMSFKRGRVQQSHSARSGLYGGWGKTWIFCPSRHWVMTLLLWGLALSWRRTFLVIYFTLMKYPIIFFR